MSKKKISCTREKVLHEDLFHDWHQLWLEQKGHYFNSPYWYKACVDAFEIDKEDIYIFVCRSESEVIGVLPLIRVKKYGFSYLKFPGEKYLDQACLLVQQENATVVTELVETASSFCRLLYLAEIREVQLFNQSKAVVKPVSECPYIDMRAGAFHEMKPKRYRRRKNKIKKHSDKLKFKVFHGKEIAEYIDVLFKIEGNSPKAKNNLDIFREKSARKLYESIIYQEETTVLAVLYYENTAIAHIFSLKTNNSITDIHTAYLEEYRTLSPGTLLLLLFVEYVADDSGVEYYDLSRGVTVQKKEYTSKINSQYNIYITNFIGMNIIRSAFFLTDMVRSLKEKYRSIG